MSWSGPPHYRWVKEYKHKRYRVKCKTLGLPRSEWTEEKSYLAANAWWRGKLATLLAKPRHPHQETLDELQARLEYAKAHGLDDDAAEIDAEVAAVTNMDDGPVPGEVDADGAPLTTADPPMPPDVSTIMSVLRLLGWNGPALDPTVLRGLSPSEAVWAERLRAPAVPADKTIGHWGERWLAKKTDECRQGVRAASGLRPIRYAVRYFTEFAGDKTEVAGIDAGLWERWVTFVEAKVALRDKDPEQGWAGTYAGTLFGHVKAFLHWLVEQGALDQLPRNFRRRPRLSRPADEIVTYSDDEVKALLGAATGEHKLHILLGLNVAFHTVDVGTLKRSEVDLKAGTITRRRTKTRRQKHTPLVCYPLWPTTLRLLRTHMATTGDLALLTPQGRPWHRVTLTAGGKEQLANPVADYHEALCKRLRIATAFKTLKKTSASKLRAGPYQDVRSHFLGHAPPRLDDKHYSAPPQTRFAEAVRWLGEQYGLL
jgi:integrase